jgi:hypothetical protein
MWAGSGTVVDNGSLKFKKATGGGTKGHIKERKYIYIYTKEKRKKNKPDHIKKAKKKNIQKERNIKNKDDDQQGGLSSNLVLVFLFSFLNRPVFIFCPEQPIFADTSGIVQY